jgi:hypothetical protein
VITSGQQITRELRRVGHETDRGIVDVGVGGRLALTSEFISPLAHTADMRTDGYLLHFRVPGDDIIWDVGFRRATP